MRGTRYTAASRLALRKICQRAFIVVYNRGLPSIGIPGEHDTIASEFLAGVVLPGRPQPVSCSAAQPLVEVGHCTEGLHGIIGRARTFPVRIKCALVSCPRLQRALTGAGTGEVAGRIITLSAGFGQTRLLGLVELVLVVRETGAVVARTRALISVRHEVVRIMSASEVPHGVVSGGGDPGDSSSSGSPPA